MASLRAGTPTCRAVEMRLLRRSKPSTRVEAHRRLLGVLGGRRRSLEQDSGHRTQGFRWSADREPDGSGLGRAVAASGSSANQGDHADRDQEDPQTH